MAAVIGSNGKVIQDHDTITVGELVEAMQRRYKFLEKRQAAAKAYKIMADIWEHREPEYEPGGVYIDAYGEVWRFLPEAGQPCGNVWQMFGTAVRAPYETPKRPLFKLVRETEPGEVPPEAEAENLREY